MQTMQQQRAQFALRKVSDAKSSGVSQKEFKSYAANFPAMIRMNGLGQAAAFYRSKGAGSESYLELYTLLSDWLKQEGQPYAGQDLLDGIAKESMHTYRLAQAEALLLLDWVKKFARAYMEEE